MGGARGSPSRPAPPGQDGVRTSILSKAIWVIVATVVLLNLPLAATRGIKAVFREALAPVQGLVTSVAGSVADHWRSVWRLPAVYRENRDLAEEIKRLRIDVQSLRYLEVENRELQALLDLAPTPGRTLIACRVIARSRDGWWRTLTLDKGTEDGLYDQMAVMSEDGLVGKIVEVSRNTATLLLLSDPSCRVSARFLESGVFGVVSGRGPSWQGDVVCRMEFIDKDAAVAPGDEVVTSGFGGVFPPDLPIGYVDEVQRDPSGLYLSATVVLRADLGALRYVFALAETGRRAPEGGAP